MSLVYKQRVHPVGDKRTCSITEDCFWLNLATLVLNNSAQTPKLNTNNLLKKKNVTLNQDDPPLIFLVLLKLSIRLA